MTDFTPVKQAFNRGGAYAASLSGTTPTSGIISEVSSLSGPWLIETQSIEIDYSRVPRAGLNVATKAITLSGATLTYGAIHATQLIGMVRATYSRTLDYSTYTTSSFQQPQLFELNAVSADANGITYGASGQVGITALGPMGTILTSQPYYRRTLYANESLQSSSIQAATFVLGDASAVVPSMVNYDQANYLTDYAFWKDDACVEGTQRNGSNPEKKLGWLGALPGPYDYSQESLLSISNFIDVVSQSVTQSQLWKVPNYLSIQYLNLYPGVNQLGIPEYDNSKHQY